MKGQWLEAAGFATETEVSVKVILGCFVLTAKPVILKEPELMQSLRRISKLSARKQRQVQKLIGVVTGKRTSV